MSHNFEDAKNAAGEVKDTFNQGAAQVGDDVRVAALDARNAVEDTADVARKSAPSLVRGAKAKIHDYRAQTEEVLEYVYEDAITKIRARPLSSVLVAALGGAALALLARRAMV